MRDTLNLNCTLKTDAAANLSSPCLVLGVFKTPQKKAAAAFRLTSIGARIDRMAAKKISDILSRGDLSADVGGTLLLHDLPGVDAARVLLVGLGDVADYDLPALRKAANSAALQLRRYKINAAGVCLTDARMRGVNVVRRARAIVEAMSAAFFEYNQAKRQDANKTNKAKKTKPREITFLVARGELAAARRGVRQGLAVAGGVHLARTLGNLPGNICTPTYLAKRAQRLAKTHAISLEVLDEADMKREKMGALLSVSRGSREPAKLIVMQYQGARARTAPVVLVGKGVTFDAGGISLKPPPAMDEMKFDMCGGASVFGAMQAAAELKLRLNLVGIVPATENLPDGAANKPGDIVTAMNGTRIEILNTDAEGRLILCDAITYAERFRPAAVIDIATLTGACVIALGAPASGLFSNDDKLAREIKRAGDAAGDRAWRMPVWDDYARQLRSNFADLANIGGRGAGAVTAACFLKHFARKQPWAHLDIAGTAWLGGDAKGATGRPVALLVEFLLNRAN